MDVPFIGHEEQQRLNGGGYLVHVGDIKTFFATFKWHFLMLQGSSMTRVFML